MVKPGRNRFRTVPHKRSGRLCCGRLQVLGYFCTRDDLPDLGLIVSSSPTPSGSPPKHADARLVWRNAVALWVVELLNRVILVHPQKPLRTMPINTTTPSPIDRSYTLMKPFPVLLQQVLGVSSHPGKLIVIIGKFKRCKLSLCRRRARVAKAATPCARATIGLPAVSHPRLSGGNFPWCLDAGARYRPRAESEFHRPGYHAAFPCRIHRSGDFASMGSAA